MVLYYFITVFLNCGMASSDFISKHSVYRILQIKVSQYTHITQIYHLSDFPLQCIVYQNNTRISCYSRDKAKMESLSCTKLLTGRKFQGPLLCIPLQWQWYRKMKFISFLQLHILQKYQVLDSYEFNIHKYFQKFIKHSICFLCCIIP